ncbi:MAG: methionyl-tRNA formyltransferase [Clostridia bacterium]|nr:methionyl-tRNA formyltransferase [Clostridia bacterium]
MKIVYMGTPDFAVLPLEALYNDGHEIVLVVTQPDKPKGRGHKLTPSPVKEFAVSNNIPVYQPESAKTDEAYEYLKSFEADLFIVAAYGQILQQRVLDIPKYGCVNIHASLLPAYRGAAPIQWCIIRGEKVTGVTTMQMNAGLDTGDMLVKEEVEITPTDTGETLHDKLATAGVNTIRETVKQIEAGTLNPVPQDDSLSCYAPMIDKTTGYIDFSKSAEEINNLVRALNSYPYASTTYQGVRFKVISAKVSEGNFDGKNGEILDVTKDGILVKCAKGALLITDVQFEGKKKMPVSEYIKGNTLEKGIILGE